jgi:hypothetical protein
MFGGVETDSTRFDAAGLDRYTRLRTPWVRASQSIQTDTAVQPAPDVLGARHVSRTRTENRTFIEKDGKVVSPFQCVDLLLRVLAIKDQFH